MKKKAKPPLKLSQPLENYRQAKKFYQNNDLLSAKAAIKAALGKQNQVPAFYLLAGEIDFNLKAWEEALYTLQQAALLDPGNERIFFLLGQVFQNLEDWEQAASCFTQVLALNPFWEEANYLAAQTFQQLGNLPKAAECILQALNLDEKINYFQLYAQILEKQAEWERAEAIYQKLLKLDPQNPVYFYQLAELFYYQAENDQARRMLQKAASLPKPGFENLLKSGIIRLELGDYPQAVKALNQAAKIKPDSAPVNLALGRAYLGMGKIKQAEARLEKALAADPQNRQAHFYLAVCWQELGKWKSSLGPLLLTLAQEENQNQGESLFRLALAYEKLGESQLALNYLNEAQGTEFSPAEISLLAGKIYLERQDFNSALGELTQVLQWEDNPVAHFYLGNLYLETGENRKALWHLETAARLSPQDLAAEFARSRALAANQEEMKALALLDAIGEKYPEYSPADLLKSQIYLALGEIASAIPPLEQALKIETDNVNLQLNLAELYQQNQQPEKAAQLLEKAGKLRPLPEIYLQLGELYLSLNQMKKAEKSLERILKLQPDSKAAYFLEQELQVAKAKPCKTQK